MEGWIVITIEPLANYPMIKANVSVSVPPVVDDVRTITNEVCEGSPAIFEPLKYYMHRFEPDRVRVTHRRVTRLYSAESTIKMEKWRRQLRIELNDAVEDEGDEPMWDYDNFWIAINNSLSFLQQYTVNECHRLHWVAKMEGKECPITMEPIVRGKTVVLGCGHMYDRDAFSKYMAKASDEPRSCCVCRQMTVHDRSYI